MVERELVHVAEVSNQAEAELIHDLLSKAGVPSTLRPGAGYHVMVPKSSAAAAREVLGGATTR